MAAAAFNRSPPAAVAIGHKRTGGEMFHATSRQRNQGGSSPAKLHWTVDSVRLPKLA